MQQAAQQELPELEELQELPEPLERQPVLVELPARRGLSGPLLEQLELLGLVGRLERSGLLGRPGLPPSGESLEPLVPWALPCSQGVAVRPELQVPLALVMPLSVLPVPPVAERPPLAPRRLAAA